MVVFRWRTSLSGAALLILGVCGCAGPESSEGALAPAASVTVEETFSSPPPEPSVSESTGQASSKPIHAICGRLKSMLCAVTLQRHAGYSAGPPRSRSPN